MYFKWASSTRSGCERQSSSTLPRGGAIRLWRSEPMPPSRTSRRWSRVWRRRERAAAIGGASYSTEDWGPRTGDGDWRPETQAAGTSGKLFPDDRRFSHQSPVTSPQSRNRRQYSLDRPDQPHRRDRHRYRHYDAPPIPILPPKRQPDQDERCRDHRELAELDAGIEAQERGQKLRARQAELREHSGEAHSVEQPESEDERDAPWGELRAQHVFDCHIDDRRGDQRLHDRGRKRNHAVHRQRERDRVRRSERGDLRQHRLPPRAQEEDSEDEEDVISPLGNDVGEPQSQILARDFEPRRRNDRRGDQDRPARLASFQPLARGLALPFGPDGQEVGAELERARPGESPRAARDR